MDPLQKTKQAYNRAVFMLETLRLSRTVFLVIGLLLVPITVWLMTTPTPMGTWLAWACVLICIQAGIWHFTDRARELLEHVSMLERASLL